MSRQREGRAVSRVNRLSRLVLLGLLLAGPSVASGLDWSFERVDTLNDVRPGCSLQLDSAGRPHITYLSDTGATRELRYAKWNGASWDIEVVASGVYSSSNHSLALDEDDVPRITYISGRRNVTYAEMTGGSWAVTTVHAFSGGNINDTAIRLDSAGNPHLSYHESYDHGFYYARSDGLTWSTEYVPYPGDSIKSSDMVLDSQDRPHVVLANNYDLYHARYDGGSWQIDRAGNWKYYMEAWGVQIERDSKDNLQAVIGEGWAMGSFTFDGESWEKETFGTSYTDFYSSIAIDDNDNSSVIYIDPSVDQLVYAVNNGSSWICEDVDSLGGVAGDLSMQRDARGVIHVAYYDSISQDLIYGVGVPEPATMSLLALGGVVVLRRRKK